MDLITYLETGGFDASELRAAFNPASGSVVSGPKGESTSAAPAPRPTRKTADKSKAATEPKPIVSIASSEADAEPATEAAADGDDKPKRKRKPRAPKDPNAPKRSLTPYLKFRNEVMSDIVAKNKENGSHMSMEEINQLVREKWSELPEAELNRRKEEYQRLTDEFHQKMEVYNAEHKAQEAGEGASESTQEAASSQPQEELASQTQEEPAEAPSRKKSKKEKKSKEKKSKE